MYEDLSSHSVVRMEIFRLRNTCIMWYYTESKATMIGLATMFSILTAMDIIGNVIVCVLIVKFKDMR